MPQLTDYIGDIRDISVEEFTARHNTGFLTLRNQRPQQNRREFATAVRTPAPLMPDNSANLPVYPLRKRPDAAYSDHVSIGRARSMDVCLEYADVSKFHAFIRTPQTDEMFTLTDAGATNGTFVSGHQLNNGETVTLENNTALRFGLCEMTFYTCSGFYDYLRICAMGLA